MEKQENKHEEVSYSSEDEYEYTYVDSDTEEQQQQQQLCGIKRNASPSFALHDKASTKGAALLSFPSFSSRQATCPHCNQEAHPPVTNCKLLQEWQATLDDTSLGILVLPSKLIVPAMKRRIEECAEGLNVSTAQAFLKLRQYEWDLQVLLHTEGGGGAAVAGPDRGLDSFPGTVSRVPSDAASGPPSRASHDDTDLSMLAMMMAVDEEDEDAMIVSSPPRQRTIARRLRSERRRASSPPPAQPARARAAAPTSFAPSTQNFSPTFTGATSRQPGPNRAPLQARPAAARRANEGSTLNQPEPNHASLQARPAAARRASGEKAARLSETNRASFPAAARKANEVSPWLSHMYSSRLIRAPSARRSSVENALGDAQGDLKPSAVDRNPTVAAAAAAAAAHLPPAPLEMVEQDDDSKPAAIESVSVAKSSPVPDAEPVSDGSEPDPSASDPTTAAVLHESSSSIEMEEMDDDAKQPAVESLPAADDSVPGAEPVSDTSDSPARPAAAIPAAPVAIDPPLDEGICHICMEEHDENTMMSMSCGHGFCRDCWRQFIEHMFEDSVLPDECLQTTCPIPSCQVVVTEEQIEQVTPHLLSQYESRQLHSFVEGHRASLRWCVGPDCKDQIAVKCRQGLFPGRGLNATVAKCGDCNTQFCFRCGQAPHRDRYCELEERLSLNGESKGKPVKECPKCGIKIEKNGGCNHMRCKCGHHFCWICLADMFDYNHFCGRLGGQAGEDEEYARLRRIEAARQAIDAVPVNLDYVCETLKESLVENDEVNRLLRAKKSMERIAHYKTRYEAHEQGQRFAENQCDRLLEGRAVDFAKATDLKSATDTDFLGAANERLVAARRMLKWTYCYTFYLPDEEKEGMISLKGLFQNHQERLERFTEKLSEISEHALTYDDRANIVNLLGIVDQCMKAIHEFDTYGANYAAPSKAEL